MGWLVYQCMSLTLAPKVLEFFYLDKTCRCHPPPVSDAVAVVEDAQHNAAVVIEDVPFVPQEERVQVETLNEHFYRIKIFYGFKDEPNVPRALMQGGIFPLRHYRTGRRHAPSDHQLP